VISANFTGVISPDVSATNDALTWAKVWTKWTHISLKNKTLLMNALLLKFDSLLIVSNKKLSLPLINCGWDS